MSSIILPGRWQQQPQGPVRLRSDVPPPTFFLIPTGKPGVLFDAASGRTVTVSNSESASVVTNAVGRGFTAGAGVTHILYTYPSADIDTAPMSALYQVQHIAQTGSDVANVRPTVNAYPPLLLRADSSGLLHQIGGGNVITSDVMTIDEGVVAVAARVTDAAGQRAYCQGQLRQDRALTTYWNPVTEAKAYRSSFAKALPISLFAFWRDHDIGDALCEQASRDPWSLVEPRKRVLYFDVGGGGTTVTLNQATETDTAQAVAKAKYRAIGQASTTDAAQAITAARRIAVGQVSETDSAQAVAPRKVLALGQATETDTAQPITEAGAITAAVGQVSETDLAQAVASSKLKAIGQPSEADSAQAVSSRKVKAIGQAAETDSVQAFAVSKTIAVGLVSETDFAQAVAHYKSLGVLQTVEADSAHSIVVPAIRTVNLSVESDTAMSFTAIGGRVVSPKADLVASSSAKAGLTSSTARAGLTRGGNYADMTQTTQF